MKTIDINCDLGEGGTFDAELMSLISSCNIACGGHFGNAKSIATTIQLAKNNNVQIGAHPSYPDLANFGRKSFKISPFDFGKTIYDQLKMVYGETKTQKAKMRHVKAHGALYNELQDNLGKSKIFVEQILSLDDGLVLFVPPNSALEEMAKGKLNTMTEGFADRLYEENFKLVPRENPNAVLIEKKQVLKQVLAMVKEGRAYLENGTFLEAKFDTVCVHSDTQNSLEILRFLNEKLPLENIQIHSK